MGILFIGVELGIKLDSKVIMTLFVHRMPLDYILINSGLFWTIYYKYPLTLYSLRGISCPGSFWWVLEPIGDSVMLQWVVVGGVIRGFCP
jgi:hypothetical protein